MTQKLIRADRYKRKVAVLFIDLDNFKRINDTLGHSIGNDLFKVTAERLIKCLRDSDTITKSSEREMAARLCGDEFTVVLTELKTEGDAGVGTLSGPVLARKE